MLLFWFRSFQFQTLFYIKFLFAKVNWKFSYEYGNFAKHILIVKGGEEADTVEVVFAYEKNWMKLIISNS